MAVRRSKAADQLAGRQQGAAAAPLASVVPALPGDAAEAQLALPAVQSARLHVAHSASPQEAALSDAAAWPQAERASTAGAVPKGSGRALEPSKESVSLRAETDAAACLALQSACSAERRAVLSGAARPADESVHRVPASAGATGARVADRQYALLPSVPVALVRLPPEAQPLREGRNPLPRRSSWVRRAAPSVVLSVPMPMAPVSRALRLLASPQLSSQPVVLPSAPFFSEESEQQTCRRRNSAAVSRRCRRQSSWNGSAARQSRAHAVYR